MGGFNKWLMLAKIADDFINWVKPVFESPADIVILILILAAVAVFLPGVIIGLFRAFRNLFLAYFEVRDDYISWKRKTIHAERNSSNELIDYEDYVDASFSNYFRGSFVEQAKSLIEYNLQNIKESLRDCVDDCHNVRGFRIATSLVKNITIGLCLIVSGAAMSVFASMLIVIVSMISLVCYVIMYFLCISADRIYYSVNNIHVRCTNGLCKKTFELPIYCCPNCGVPHKYLRPSKWGIVRRKCVCGERLPCLFRGRSKPRKIPKEEFKALCPECRHAIAGHSRPLGIALLGGVNSGKSTFKTAFLFEFINECAVNHDARIDYQDKDTEYEMDNIGRYYRGERTVPETRPDPINGFDVKSFNFYVEHDAFSERRILQIYDMPGEVFENQNAQDRMEHFTYIEGIVFLLDPYSMQAVAGMTDDVGEMRVDMMNMNTLAERLVESLSQVPDVKKNKKKFAIPVAVCINKADTGELRNRIGLPAAEKLTKAYPKKFASEFDAMDYLCRAFLQKNDMGNVVTTIDNNFSTVHYFSCTSMGYVPRGSKRVRFQPENVSAAVHWIFSRADRQFSTVFDDYRIKDISENKKKLGMNLSYYNEIENEL